MALRVFREYLGEYEPVGVLSGDGNGRPTFYYEDAYVHDERANALSQSLPLREGAFASSECRPFFEGMVPEGQVRTELAHRFQIPASDFVRLLERIGGECAGALAFCPDADESILEGPGYRQVSESDFEAMRQSSVRAMASSMQTSRLSLAGAQAKTGWLLPQGLDPAHAGAGEWFVPLGAAPSTHVVKIAGEGMADLAYNEHACMEVARMCGLSTARTWVLDAMPNVLVSERYDRFWPERPRSIDGVNAPLRLHQEDFCQLLGWPPYAKYETDPMSCYARTCGTIIRETSADAIADTQAFALQVAFDYAVGNCDSHMKNHSMLWSPAWDAERLAPAYDIVCTTILGYDHNLGIAIGDHRCIDEVAPEDLELFAGDVGMPVALFRRRCAELAEALPQAFGRLREEGGKLACVADEIYGDAERRIRVLGEFAAG